MSSSSPNPINYAMVLSLVYPTAEWSLTNNFDLDTLAWEDHNSIPKPSHDDLVAAFELTKPREAARRLREKRNQLLQQSDIYALPDFPHSVAAKQAWLAYRQHLRDLPEISSPKLTNDLALDESSVSWPVKPSS